VWEVGLRPSPVRGWWWVVTTLPVACGLWHVACGGPVGSTPISAYRPAWTPGLTHFVGSPGDTFWIEWVKK